VPSRDDLARRPRAVQERKVGDFPSPARHIPSSMSDEPTTPSQRAAHALIIALGAIKKQKDYLEQQNDTLAHQNAEFKRYCSSISGMADILVTMKGELEEEKRKVRDIGDSLIMLWGQLAAGGVIAEERQRVKGISNIPAAPIDGVAAVEYGVSDLYCTE